MTDDEKTLETGERWPTPREWGRQHGFPDGFVYRGVQERSIPFIKVGKRIYIHPNALEMMVQIGEREVDGGE